MLFQHVDFCSNCFVFVFIYILFFYLSFFVAECENLTHENALFKEELNELKSQLLVAEFSLQSEMHNKETRAQEEIASLQQLIQGFFYFIFFLLTRF